MLHTIQVKIGKVGHPIDTYLVGVETIDAYQKERPELIYGSLLELLDAVGLRSLISESGIGDVTIDNKTYEYEDDGERLLYQFGPNKDYHSDVVYIEDIDIHEGSVIVLS